MVGFSVSIELPGHVSKYRGLVYTFHVTGIMVITGPVIWSSQVTSHTLTTEYI